MPNPAFKKKVGPNSNAACVGKVYLRSQRAYAHDVVRACGDGSIRYHEREAIAVACRTKRTQAGAKGWIRAPADLNHSCHCLHVRIQNRSQQENRHTTLGDSQQGLLRGVGEIGRSKGQSPPPVIVACDVNGTDVAKSDRQKPSAPIKLLWAGSKKVQSKWQARRVLNGESRYSLSKLRR